MSTITSDNFLSTTDILAINIHLKHTAERRERNSRIKDNMQTLLKLACNIVSSSAGTYFNNYMHILDIIEELAQDQLP
jgi:hypothetical protein